MKYHCIRQHDVTDCGAACLATICRQNGYKIGITRIREVAGTDKQGTNAFGVIKAAQELGFLAKGIRGMLGARNTGNNKFSMIMASGSRG